MGCWNGSCALSGLPIFHGEQTYVYLLVHPLKEEVDGHCNPTTYFYPLVYHFEGEYNDYGGIENETGLLIDILVDEVKQLLVELDTGENQYRDIAVKRDGFNLEKLLEADHEGRLFVDANFIGKSSVHHITIRKDVLDHLFNTYKHEEYIGDSKYKTVGYAEVLEECQLAAKEIFNSEQPSSSWSYTTLYLSNANIGSKHLTRALYSARQQWILLPPDDLVEAAVARNYELFSTIIEHVVHNYWLGSFMHETRRSWIVPSGAGSQQGETTAHRALANTTLTIADKLDRQHEEYE